MIRTSVARGRKAMPKKKTPVRSPWTKDDIRQLKAYSKARTPVVEVAEAMKRTEAAVRPKLVSVIAVEDRHHNGSPKSGRPLSVYPRGLRFARPAIKVVGADLTLA